MEAPQQDQHQECDAGDKPVIDGRGFQVEAEQRRPRDAAKAVLAAGDVGPAERHRIEHRRQRQRQQREIDAAPSQDQESERRGNHGDDQQRRRWSGRRTNRASSCAAAAPRHRPQDRTRRRGRTTRGRYARPECSAPCRPARKMTTSVADVMVRPSASSTGGSTSSAECGDQQAEWAGALSMSAPHSNRVMRSPNRPRGRNSNTRSISR